jgi:hypothetical protein
VTLVEAGGQHRLIGAYGEVAWVGNAHAAAYAYTDAAIDQAQRAVHEILHLR